MAMARKLNRIEFTLREGEDFIPLISLLKACDVVYSGAEAQEVVSAGMVLRNGEVETRKRAKITAGEVVIFQDFEIASLYRNDHKMCTYVTKKFFLSY